MENQQQTNTSLCRGGCGFFGAAATEGLCSKCYKDHIKRQQDTARISPTVSVSVPLASSSSSSSVDGVAPPSASPIDKMTCSQAALSTEEVTAKLESAVAAAESAINELSTPDCTPSASPSEAAAPAKKGANRCQQCKKRVGLTGFSCRCGGLFCSEHRYDTAHSCSFDYKAMEREELRKNNPVVVSDKIQRI